MKTEGFSTDAILLRRIAYGDHDLIVTFLAPDRGKFSSIAKSARKSIKRFAGLLEPFTGLRVVCAAGRGKLLILKEAAMRRPLGCIRCDFLKTAYASYWVELVDGWLEEGERQADLFHLLQWALDALDAGEMPVAHLSVLFQMRLMTLSGFSPNLLRCARCKIEMASMPGIRVGFDLAKGGLLCENCGSGPGNGRITLSKGAVKQLRWLENVTPECAGRIRFTSQSLRESLDFLEAFVPYHLGKHPRSLTFLRRIRTDSPCKAPTR